MLSSPLPFPPAPTPRRFPIKLQLLHEWTRIPCFVENDRLNLFPMNHYRFLASLALATALLFAPLAALHAADASKPNIIFILADDMGIPGVGCSAVRSKHRTSTPWRLAGRASKTFSPRRSARRRGRC